MNNLDARILDLPLSVLDLILEIDGLNDRLRGGYIHPSETSLVNQDVSDTDIMLGREEWEAHAYCEAVTYMFKYSRDMAITEETILSLHQQLFRYAPDSIRHQGTYKNGENKVATTDTDGNVLRVLVEGTPSGQTPQALRDLVVWYNEAPTAARYPSLLRISAFLVELLKIHPFVDGNGRVSRALMDLLLLKDGYVAEYYYPHEKIVEADTEAYYRALSHSQETFGTSTESIRAWTEYFLNTLLEQTKRAIAKRAADAARPQPAPHR